MAELDQNNFEHLTRRSIIPLIRPSPKERPAFQAARSINLSQRHFAETFAAPEEEDLPDLNNVQGDVIFLFPKKAENFIFFRISDVRSFKTALGSFTPTTSGDVLDFVHMIALQKKQAGQRRIATITNAQTQIAFTRMGMNFMGERAATGDVRFDTHAMRDDKTNLGDQRDWDPAFEKTHPDPVNGSVNDDTGALHGVFSVAGSDPTTCTAASKAVTDHFGSSITVISTMEGRARPGSYAGHEHFGYEDGVSQPAPRGLVQPRKGQIQVNPGVIILGYKGDPVVDDPTSKTKRPSWAKDGTMMVFRKLEQFVPEFDAYLKKNGPRWAEFAPGGAANNLSPEEGAELFGARIIGRWKSGAPIANAPVRDDPEMAVDKDRNNDFDYHVRDNPNISPNALSDYYCPFSAHTRKTAPRSLNPYIRQEFLESGMIVRAGLPYGIEVTDAEKRSGVSSENPQEKRGLLFVAYQSSLDQGFVRQTIAYANNDYFPTTSLVPQNHGQDPIIGGPPAENSPSAPNEVKFITDPSVPPKTGDQVNLLINGSNGDRIQVNGFAEVQPLGADDPPGVPQEFFVTSRGGEYFFVPSISTLKTWASDGSLHLCEDIMFVLDATSSMQKYIDQARDRIDSICNGIVQSANWAPSDVRIGLIAFRDHPQKDRSGNEQSYGFISRSYGFRSDIAAVKSDLTALEASGGGDGPEAQCDALDDALNAAWKNEATKVAVLVTDSPPHGIDEYQDRLPDGCPNQNDPVRTADLMADAGITLHVIACEPSLTGSFSKAHDFYTGITQKTGGTMVALSDETTLSNIIIGRISETSDIQRQAVQNRSYVLQQAKQNATFDSISKDLYSRLSSSNVQLNRFDVESIYEAKTDGDSNANIWLNAKQIDSETRGKLKKVTGLRVKEDYRKGGAKYQKAQTMNLSKQPITLAQTDSIVKACLLKK